MEASPADADSAGCLDDEVAKGEGSLKPKYYGAQLMYLPMHDEWEVAISHLLPAISE
jgi:hypothetical protein